MAFSVKPRLHIDTEHAANIVTELAQNLAQPITRRRFTRSRGLVRMVVGARPINPSQGGADVLEICGVPKGVQCSGADI
jgi:hypothetical protein